MIWSGLGQKWEKNSIATRPGKITQLNNPEKKKSSAGWPGKKVISRLARKKNSTRILCPRPPQIINGSSLSSILILEALYLRNLITYHLSRENLQTSKVLGMFLNFKHGVNKR